MADLDLRPLSLGEILDRTFSLYRRNFLLFAGIAAIPQLLVLALRLTQAFFTDLPGRRASMPGQQFQSSGAVAGILLGGLVGLIVYLVAYLFAQGGTVYAVSELYLGRTTTIGSALSRMRGQLASLFGVVILNGFAVMGGLILLIIPGIYVACRLITCIPAALLEDLGPRSSLERSFALTKDNAGRAFVIYLLYMVLVYAAAMLFTFPFYFVIGLLGSSHPESIGTWMVMAQIGTFFGDVLVGPFLTIATSVFYYDLRVRKEAFDLQFMMNPSGQISSGTPGAARMLT